MKKAVLVGINKYQDLPLNGCINDELLFYKITLEKMGFDIAKMLTDKQATTKNILNALKILVKDSKPGDILLFHYSGHGSQVPAFDWTTSREADGMDEIICPIDLDWEHPIRDQDMGNIFKNVIKGVNITIILDACHSGTGLRNPTSGVVSRYLPPPPEKLLMNPKFTIDDELRLIAPEYNVNDRQTQKRKFVVTTDLQGDAILLSGCKDHQTSADALINGRYHGAFTYYLVYTLARANYDITYIDLITRTGEALKANGYDQVPQVEGLEINLNKKFLR